LVSTFRFRSAPSAVDASLCRGWPEQPVYKYEPTWQTLPSCFIRRVKCPMEATSRARHRAIDNTCGIRAKDVFRLRLTTPSSPLRVRANLLILCGLPGNEGAAKPSIPIGLLDKPGGLPAVLASGLQGFALRLGSLKWLAAMASEDWLLNERESCENFTHTVRTTSRRRAIMRNTNVETGIVERRDHRRVSERLGFGCGSAFT